MSGHPINPTKRIFIFYFLFFIFELFDLVVFGLHGMKALKGTPKKLRMLAMKVAPKNSGKK